MGLTNLSDDESFRRETCTKNVEDEVYGAVNNDEVVLGQQQMPCNEATSDSSGNNGEDNSAEPKAIEIEDAPPAQGWGHLGKYNSWMTKRV